MSKHQNIRMLLLLMGVIFISMLSRLIFSPLLVFIQEDLSLTGEEAGSLFLMITLGFTPGMLLSGFISARLKHRGAIVFSLILSAFGMGVAAVSGSYGMMNVGLFILGFGTGIYPPSGIISITETFSQEKTGKALAIHELGPNLAYVGAPLLVVALFPLIGWRGILGTIFLLNIAILFLYRRYGLGGEGYGKQPNLRRLGDAVRNPQLWFCFLLYCIAMSAMQGLYSILPYYLITVKKLDPTTVNLLVGLSRISSILTLLISGFMIDRFGFRLVIMAAFSVSGLSTLFMVGAKGSLLSFLVVLQPALLSAFYPAILLALSRIGPQESQNVTLSFVLSFSVLVGTGVIPAVFGWLTDRGKIEYGFLLLGGAMLLAVGALHRNRF
ncbi:MAG TPA: MFS transporter [Spirochaetales bacterium]|nr:MFS transporter [Spirochaetales bacterium]